MFCGKCGARLPDDAVRCSKCGAPVRIRPEADSLRGSIPEMSKEEYLASLPMAERLRRKIVESSHRRGEAADERQMQNHLRRAAKYYGEDSSPVLKEDKDSASGPASEDRKNSQLADQITRERADKARARLQKEKASVNPEKTRKPRKEVKLSELVNLLEEDGKAGGTAVPDQAAAEPAVSEEPARPAPAGAETAVPEKSAEIVRPAEDAVSEEPAKAAPAGAVSPAEPAAAKEAAGAVGQAETAVSEEPVRPAPAGAETAVPEKSAEIVSPAEPAVSEEPAKPLRPAEAAVAAESSGLEEKGQENTAVPEIDPAHVQAEMNTAAAAGENVQTTDRDQELIALAKKALEEQASAARLREEQRLEDARILRRYQEDLPDRMDQLLGKYGLSKDAAVRLATLFLIALLTVIYVLGRGGQPAVAEDVPVAGDGVTGAPSYAQPEEQQDTETDQNTEGEGSDELPTGGGEF